MQLSDRIGRRMKLQDLHVLMTVVQAGTMGKAAQRLNTTQPNISRSIAELEHALGVRLLDRRRQGIEPTEYGRALLDCGVAVFDDLRQGAKNIEFLADPAAGEVRIGSSAFLAGTFVSAVIRRLSRRYPRIVFHLVTADETDTLRRELSERNVDLLIARRLGLFTEEKFGFEILYDDSYVVVAGAQSPWVRRRSIALAELANESWLLPPPDRALGPVYLEAFRASGLDYPRTAVFTISPEVRIGLLVSGRFLTIVPMSVLRFSKRPEIKVLPVELQHARVPIGIVTLKNRTLTPSLGFSSTMLAKSRSLWHEENGRLPCRLLAHGGSLYARNLSQLPGIKRRDGGRSTRTRKIRDFCVVPRGRSTDKERPRVTLPSEPDAPLRYYIEDGRDPITRLPRPDRNSESC